MSVRRNAASILVALQLAALAHAAGVFTLVTRADVAAERRFEAGTRALVAPPQSSAFPPRITVVSPHPGDSPIASPLRIELAFETSPDAHILPDTLRVRYGLLKIDITSKLKPYATVTEKGLLADNAAIPAGFHRLFIEISDSAGRTTTSQIQFTVT